MQQPQGFQSNYLLYTVKGFEGQCKHVTKLDCHQVIKVGHRGIKLQNTSKGGSVAYSNIDNRPFSKMLHKE